MEGRNNSPAALAAPRAEESQYQDSATREYHYETEISNEKKEAVESVHWRGHQVKWLAMAVAAKLLGNDAVIGIVIASHAKNGVGKCILKHRTIANESGLSRSTAKRSIEKYKLKGFLTTETQPNSDCLLYQLMIPKGLAAELGVVHSERGVAHPGELGGSSARELQKNYDMNYSSELLTELPKKESSVIPEEGPIENRVAPDSRAATDGQPIERSAEQEPMVREVRGATEEERRTVACVRIGTDALRHAGVEFGMGIRVDGKHPDAWAIDTLKSAGAWPELERLALANRLPVRLVRERADAAGITERLKDAIASAADRAQQDGV